VESLQGAENATLKTIFPCRLPQEQAPAHCAPRCGPIPPCPLPDPLTGTETAALGPVLCVAFLWWPGIVAAHGCHGARGGDGGAELPAEIPELATTRLTATAR